MESTLGISPFSSASGLIIIPIRPLLKLASIIIFLIILYLFIFPSSYLLLSIIKSFFRSSPSPRSAAKRTHLRLPTAHKEQGSIRKKGIGRI